MTRNRAIERVEKLNAIYETAIAQNDYDMLEWAEDRKEIAICEIAEYDVLDIVDIASYFAY